MSDCTVLSSNIRTAVTFDATNPEHVEAFRMMCLGEVDALGNVTIRQHPTLRFRLEFPHVDVRSMMLTKIAQQYVKAFQK